MRSLLLCLFAVLLLSPVRGAEPFFKKGDVIALVGGEDMVVASEYGYLELLLTRALPDYHLRFRNLAWEGDTVFEQRRDLNFPSYEEQLDEIGATVVIAQFGQMESLAAAQEPRRRGGAEWEKAALAEFIAAYEKLIERFSGGGKRRVVVLAPGDFESVDASAQANRDLYAEAIPAMRLQPGGLMDISPGQRPGLSPNKAPRPEGAQESPAPAGADAVTDAEPRVSPGANLRQPSGLKLRFNRDGIHLAPSGHVGLALRTRAITSVPHTGTESLGYSRKDGAVRHDLEPLRQLIIAKNRLWFDYWRPQNWAFLAGDRTAQPSSRDHLDPSKRWFPPEREAFLPLIEAKEKQIDALAAQLAQGK